MKCRSLIQLVLLLALALSSRSLFPAQAAGLIDARRHLSTGRIHDGPVWTLATAFQQPPAQSLVALPPNAPTDLAATEASRSTIALSWVDQSDDETSFWIERSPDGINAWGFIGTVISNTTTFVDRARTCNTPYFYRVRAYNLSGVSLPSASASATILDCTLNTPMALSATPAAQNSIELRWSDQNDNETGFSVERSPDGMTGWAPIGETPQDRTMYVDTGLLCSPPLFYRVRAYNAGAVSGWSMSASTHICPPNSPTGLTAVALSRMNISLDWTDTSDNETGFAIERSPDGAANWVEIDRIAANSTGYTSRGLSCNTSYYYRIRTFHPSAASAYSTVVSANTAACIPQTIYVKRDARGANIGDTWTSAYTDLQDALTAAIADDQIWVAAGSYQPNIRHQEQGYLLASFHMPEGVTLYGGFKGDETARDQRDWQHNVTLLYGGGVYHVVVTTNVGPATILDGFTITGGSAIGYNTSGSGAGWYNDHGNPTIRNCIFDGNYAVGGGGGLENDHGSPLLANVVFHNNTAGVGGGGMANYGGTPTLRDVVFRKNSVTNGSIGGGGGLSNTGGGNATLIGVSFEENTSARYAGGLFNEGSAAALTNASFTGNHGDYGGAITNIGNGTMVISDATFLTNTSQEGAGIANYRSNLTLAHATFRRNAATYAGGGVYVQYSTGMVALHTLVFTGNYANQGAGVAFDGSAGSISNATFVGNRAWYGGGLYGSYSTLVAHNNIVWNNSTFEGGQVNGVDMRYSLVQGGAVGPGNMNADPRFVNSAGTDNVVGTDDDDLRLRAGSPAIDAGDNLALPSSATTDLAGDPRFVDDPSAPDVGVGSSPQVDMGAYEYQNVLPLPMPSGLAASPIRRSQITLQWQDNSADETGFLIERSSNDIAGWTIIATVGADVTAFTDRLLPCDTSFFYRVRATNTLGNSAFAVTLAATTTACVPTTIYVDRAAVAGGNHGGTWADAYINLQDAVNTSIAGDQIWVAQGSYTPGTQRADSFVLKNGVDLYGGFTGTETALTQRDWQTNTTILSGDIGGAGDPNDNAYHVLTVHDTSRDQIVDGFTITAGTADRPYDMGGGLYALNAHLLLRNLRFTGNTARMGGAISGDASAIVLDSVTVTNNIALQGGGLYITNASALTLTQVLIENNQATVGGNAVPDGIGGGGLATTDSHLRLEHVTFHGNQTSNIGGNGFAAGGGMTSQGGSLSMSDVMFVDNTGENGGGLFNATTNARLEHVAFQHNSVTWWGGGFTNQGDRLRMSDVTFSGNSASWGGGIYLSGAGSTIANAQFRQNTAYNGAGMVTFGGDPVISNAVFSNNAASNSGAGIYNVGAGLLNLVGVTFSGNAADATGGAIYNYLGSYVTIRNSILWRNSAPDGAELFVLDSLSSTIHFSVVEGGYAGDGNQAANPRFVLNPGPGSDATWGTGDDVVGDLHLRADSPAIDAGDNDAVPQDTLDLDGDRNTSEPLPFSLEGTSRFVDDPDRVDSGHGLAPIVDMGAYEFTPVPAIPPSQPRSDLSVQISIDHTHVRRGDTVKFDIIVANAGPDPARAVTVTTALPAGMVLSTPIAATSEGNSWTCQDIQASHQLVCTRESLEVGTTSAILVTATLTTIDGGLVIDTQVDSASESTSHQPATAAIQLIAADDTRRLWLPWILR